VNKKPINIIIQIDKEINTNIKDYCNYVDKVFVRKDLGIPASDKLKKNGTFERGLFFLLEGSTVYKRVKIQTMLWSKPTGERVYISIFPSNIIKYNKVDTGLIEFISNNVKEGEYIFQHVDDSGDTIDCEDILTRSCYRVERACMSRSLSALLNSRFTEILNKPIEVGSFFEYLKIKLKFRQIYLLLKTASICYEYGVIIDPSLSSLNLILKFLR